MLEKKGEAEMQLAVASDLAHLTVSFFPTLPVSWDKIGTETATGKHFSAVDPCQLPPSPDGHPCRCGQWGWVGTESSRLSVWSQLTRLPGPPYQACV